MNNNDYSEAIEILSTLLFELVSEEDKAKEIVSGHSYKIEELNQQIDACRKSEDIDFRVFSPRNISHDNSEKIVALENEKSNYEREKTEAAKSLSYYSGKTEKIRKVISILKDNNREVLSSDISNEEIETNTVDPFEALFKSSAEINSDNKVSTSIWDEDIVEKDDSNKVTKDNNKKEIEQTNDSADVSVNNNDPVENTESNSNGIPVDDIKRVCHKVEFSEKILNNDRVRAKIELKDVITDLKELIRVYE